MACCAQPEGANPVVESASFGSSDRAYLTFDRDIDALNESGAGPWAYYKDNIRRTVTSRIKTGDREVTLTTGTPTSSSPGANRLIYTPPPDEPAAGGVPMLGPRTYLMPYGE